ncbi:pirin family protein [Ferrovibrio sp.]|uniref:pirin family protein n=1 Tax=Ferrovibrio sp. TaxID=1917215 RepID=UPI001B5D9710|nr:pirin family protein [Ferrovibrio sp.]MBP7065642.1 pirin family protein [Ferrovibrio sp.]
MSEMVEMLIQPRKQDLGDGFVVRRVLPFAKRRHVGPFVFLDHMGPAQFAPGQGLDVRPHPHIGLATVTYLFSGEILHRDSLGYLQPIRPGDVNWMTAGSGIVHSERTRDEVRAAGQLLHGVQAWVALPLEHEEIAPSFRHHPAASLPEWREGDATLRLVAGSYGGHVAPAQCLSPMFYIDLDLPQGASFTLNDEYAERAVHVSIGGISVAGTSYGESDLLVLREGDAVTLTAEQPSRLMLLGGAPLDAPRQMWWNFVSSSKERIEQAKADWQADRFGKVPGESEFIPLPPG